MRIKLLQQVQESGVGVSRPVKDQDHGSDFALAPLPIGRGSQVVRSSRLLDDGKVLIQLGFRPKEYFAFQTVKEQSIAERIPDQSLADTLLRRERELDHPHLSGPRHVK